MIVVLDGNAAERGQAVYLTDAQGRRLAAIVPASVAAAGLAWTATSSARRWWLSGSARLTSMRCRLIWAPRYRTLAAQTECSGSAPFHVNTGVNGAHGDISRGTPSPGPDIQPLGDIVMKAHWLTPAGLHTASARVGVVMRPCRGDRLAALMAR
jgi:hypothetical protein